MPLGAARLNTLARHVAAGGGGATYRADAYDDYLELAVTFDDTVDGSGTEDVAYLINTTLTDAKTKTQGGSSTINGDDNYWSSPDYEGSLDNARVNSALTYNLSSNGGSSMPASNSGTFVIEGWFKAENSSTNSNWCISSADSGGRFLFGINNGSSFSWANENNAGIGTAWCHIAIVNTNGSRRFYKDGVYKGAWYSANSGFSILNIGQFNSGDGNDYIGRIQDLRVYIGTNKGYTGANSSSANFTLPSSIVESF